MAGEPPQVPLLVLGMGSFAYGRERRATTMLGHMDVVEPYFLVSKWGDGTVQSLVHRSGFEFEVVPYGYIGRAHPLWTLIGLVQLPVYWFRALRAHFKRRFEGVLLLHLDALVHGLVPILVLRLLGVGLVLYLGDIPSNRRIHRWAVRLVNRLAGCVVANSRAVARGLVDVGVRESLIHVVYNGVDLDALGDAKASGSHDLLPRAEEGYVVAFIGQLHERKGVLDFLRVAEKVLASGSSDCLFLLVGDLPEEGTGVRKRIEGCLDRHPRRIVRLDRVGRMEEVYDRVDLVTVLSRYPDPAPNVVLEAMASEIPVIGTAIGGIPELLGEAGVLVEPGDVEAVVRAVFTLSSDRRLSERYRRAGVDRVRACFDPKRNASEVERLLTSALAAHG